MTEFKDERGSRVVATRATTKESRRGGKTLYVVHLDGGLSVVVPPGAGLSFDGFDVERDAVLLAIALWRGLVVRSKCKEELADRPFASSDFLGREVMTVYDPGTGMIIGLRPDRRMALRTLVLAFAKPLFEWAENESTAPVVIAKARTALSLASARISRTEAFPVREPGAAAPTDQRDGTASETASDSTDLKSYKMPESEATAEAISAAGARVESPRRSPSRHAWEAGYLSWWKATAKDHVT